MFAHLEKFSLNFSSSSFVSVSIFSILNHPCSFVVYHYLFGVFYLSKVLFLGFFQSKGDFCHFCQNAVH